jgi:hypothetical protein
MDLYIKISSDVKLAFSSGSIDIVQESLQGTSGFLYTLKLARKMENKTADVKIQKA